MIILYGSGAPERMVQLAQPIIKEAPYRVLGLQPEFPVPEAGDVLVVMGGDAFAQLKATGYIQKNRALGSLRETPLKVSANSGFILVSYSPGMTLVDASVASQIRYDFRLAQRLHKYGHAQPVLGAYQWLSGAGLLEYVQGIIERAQAAAKPVPASLDLETMGFYPWYSDKHIVTAQMTDETGKAYAYYNLPIENQNTPDGMAAREAVRLLITSPWIKLRGANLKFDLLWLRVKWDLICTNFKFDTLLAGSLLDENRSNSLSWHSKEHTDLGGYDKPLEDKYDKGKMEEIPLEDLLPYAAGDVDACLRVSEVQLAALSLQGPLLNFYVHLVHPAARAMENIEFRGVAVDRAKFMELAAELEQDMAEAHSACIRMLPPRLRAKHAGGLSLSRTALIRDYMFTPLGLGLTPLKQTPKGGIAADAAHLRMFLDDARAKPFLEQYFRWTAMAKTLGTYIEGFLEHLRPDGRFHPTYMLFNGNLFENEDTTGGTTTGRTSVKNPALQTLPKHAKKGQKNWPKKLRQCYPAPDGFVFFEADYAQGELRVTADVANETKMLDAYKQGLDLHCVTGASFANMGYEEFFAAYERMDNNDKTLDKDLAALVKLMRQKAKSANFGLLYGMSADGLVTYARDSFGIAMTLKEAEDVRNGFFKTYPGLVAWHNLYKNKVNKYQCVVSPLGRVRHLPLIKSPDGFTRSQCERQAINSPIQATLSDMCLLAISILEERYGESGDLQIAGMTHDSIYGYIRISALHTVAPDLTHTMSNLPLAEKFGWRPKVDFPADIKIGPNWGDLQNYKPGVTPEFAMAA